MDTFVELEDFAPIEGAGGKKGGGGAKEASDTLRSSAKARVMEMLGEGVIKGIRGGLTGVFLNETPIQNADGSLNFEGVKIEERWGHPDQAHINGIPTVETPYTVDQQVKNKTGPVIRRITEANADAVRVIVRLPSLVKYNDKGDLEGTMVGWSVAVREVGGPWVNETGKSIVNEKSASPWQIAHRLELPGKGPWDVKVERWFPDSVDTKTQNETYFESYTVLVEGKFTYPNTAYTFIEIDAEQFGSSLPSRAYNLDGLLIQVPSNYDPVKRVYNGIWDGNFKVEWSNNPAWVFYDLLTNDRYGLGEFVEERRIDKWMLYQIAQYCDEKVPSGLRNAQDDTIWEPRFTFNGVINSREEAFTVLRNVSNAFRGMAFWAIGQVYAVADIPADYVKLVTPANVLEGRFTYSGTSKKSRHSVAMVSWNDQDDFGRPAVEVVINPETLEKYGWRETAITKHGCTSRGEAHRFGKWILDTEQNETETVEYVAGWDHAELRPFDIIAIADPKKAAVRTGGRIAAVSQDLRGITLDSTFEFGPTDTHTLAVTMPDGSIERNKIVSYVPAETGRHHVVLEGPLSVRPEPNAIWMIAATSVNPRQYRVLTVQEVDEEGVQFRVTALFHDPNKYARVEKDIILDPIQYTRPSIVTPPTNLVFNEVQVVQDGVAISKIVASWMPGSPLQSRFMVRVSGPRGVQEFREHKGPTIEITQVVAGVYSFEIRAYGPTGGLSRPLNGQYQAHGWGGLGEPQVVNLRLPGGGLIFNGRDVELAWDNFLPGGNAFYQHNVVDVYDSRTNKLRRSEIVHSPGYIYTFERNQADGRQTELVDDKGQPLLDSDGNPVRGGASRHLRFEVRLVDVADKASQPAVLTVHNPAPKTPVPEAFGGINQIFLSWVNPEDLDFVATLVWISEEPNFDPAAVTPTLDTSTSVLSWPVNDGKPRYVRIACYDSFGRDDLDYSPQIQVTPISNVVDVEPPERPTGFKATSELLPDGRARVVFSWDAVADKNEDLAGYQLEVRQVFADGTKGNFVPFATNETSYELVFDAGTLLEARLNAYDVHFNRSLRTEIIIVSVIGDEEPPAVPVGIRARGSWRSLWITWTPNEEADLVGYEISFLDTDAVPQEPVEKDETQEPAPVGGTASSSDDPGDKSVLTEEEPKTFFVTKDAFFVFQEVGTGGQKYVRVRAFDTSGNRSEWTDAVVAKTVSAPELYEDLDINLPAPVDALPRPIPEGTPKKLLLSTDGLVYVQHEGDWEVETSAKLITGKVAAQQIADLAITREKLAEAAVGREQIGFNEISATEIDDGAISTPKLRSNSIDARKLRTDAVETHHISAGAIVADKIEAGAITTDKIAAFSITAQHLTASIIGADQLIAGSITSEKLASKQVITLSAQIEDAIIDDAHIVNLNAAKLIVTDVEAGRVLVAGINKSSTTIDPGRIKIAGSVTLQDWRFGPDSTEINGRAIATGTISADKAEFGLRGITVEGLQFEHNSPSFNRVSWTSGTVRYVGDDGNTITRNISASEALFAGAVVYLCYVKGSSSLSVSTQASVVGDPNTIVLASYSGNTNLYVTYGRTVIDGLQIKTGTIQAANIAANAIDASKIMAGQVGAGHLAANSVATDKLQAESVRAEHIRAGAITADKIALGNVSGNHLANGIVDINKLANGSVTYEKIANGAIGNEKIADRQIWADAKIALQSITGTLITPNAISTPHLQAGSIVSDKLAARSIIADHLNINTINADHINANSITTQKINRGAVSGFTYSGSTTGTLWVDGGMIVVLYWVEDGPTPFRSTVDVSVQIHDRQVLFSRHIGVIASRSPGFGGNPDTDNFLMQGSGIAYYDGAPSGNIGIIVSPSGGSVRWMAMNFKR